MSTLEDYIQDNYGSCDLGSRKCVCIRPDHPQYRGWSGRMCTNWTPVKWRSWEDMRKELKDLR